MDSSPVTMMSTIHPLSGEDSLVLRMRKYPGNKSTNASGANSIFLPGECQKELDIPVIVDAYNLHKVGINVADQYRTYFDTQLISRCNWYPLFYWILETALINSLIIYQDLPANTECTVVRVSPLAVTSDTCYQANALNHARRYKFGHVVYPLVGVYTKLQSGLQNGLASAFHS